MLTYKMGLARQAFQDAAEALEEWKAAQQTTQRAANGGETPQSKREKRRRRLMRRWRNIEAARAQRVAALDAERYRDYASVDEALDDGVFGYKPAKTE